MKDVTTPTASLLITITTKLQTTTKITEDTLLIIEVKDQLMKFAHKLSSIYCRMHQLDMAQYFDPRVSIDNKKLHAILAALKVDCQAVNKSKFGLEMLFEKDSEGTSIFHSRFI